MKDIIRFKPFNFYDMLSNSNKRINVLICYMEKLYMTECKVQYVNKDKIKLIRFGSTFNQCGKYTGEWEGGKHLYIIGYYTE